MRLCSDVSGEHRGDHLGEPSQAVDAGDREVLDASVGEVAQDRQPEVRTLDLAPLSVALDQTLLNDPVKGPYLCLRPICFKTDAWPPLQPHSLISARAAVGAPGTGGQRRCPRRHRDDVALLSYCGSIFPSDSRSRQPSPRAPPVNTPGPTATLSAGQAFFAASAAPRALADTRGHHRLLAGPCVAGSVSFTAVPSIFVRLRITDGPG
jgi:hypothetical protein